MFFFFIYWNERTWMSSNKSEVVKCEKFTDKYVPNKHTEKSVNFPVTIFLGEILLILNFVLIGPILIVVDCEWRYVTFLVKIENHGCSTLISPTAKLRVIFSWKLSQMPCGNHAIYHLIKGVSFQRNWVAVLARAYNKIILASSSELIM